MKRWIFTVSVATIFAIATTGCGTSTDTASDLESGTSNASGDLALVSYDGKKLCGSCGHAFAKESDHVCDADHAACEKCNLHAGSELCCKLGEEFAGKTLCGSCGQIAGTEVCCVDTAEVCQTCSLHKGSPLCCKLVATSVTTEEAATESTEEPAAESTEAPLDTSAETSNEPSAESNDAGAEPSETGTEPGEAAAETSEGSDEPADEDGESN